MGISKDTHTFTKNDIPLYRLLVKEFMNILTLSHILFVLVESQWIKQASTEEILFPSAETLGTWAMQCKHSTALMHHCCPWPAGTKAQGQAEAAQGHKHILYLPCASVNTLDEYDQVWTCSWCPSQRFYHICVKLELREKDECGLAFV